MRTMTLTTTLAAIAVVALAGCSDDGGGNGGGGDDKDVIAGKDVAAKAETALESEVDNLAEGGFECPDVDREKGATATCTRTSEASGYYLVVDGQVEVSEVSGDDFGLDVQMEDAAKEFGQTAESIEADLSTQAESKFGEAPQSLECPDLPGEEGATITCSLTVAGEDKSLEVTATEVDLTNYTMSYTFAEK
ncbi:DUF4333 domain-containing protein [Nocardioides sp. Root140]|uniref:DUF4333 domain-containing protein n=1 Tax=Nocardioides sp. Root140 TaxID=1736460 RepID=UPI0006F4CC44|nr:DUF4333 domain-containing protein [Nocardioides sp. Root140]KQY57187.1 hypothetical protein ASD30_13165 [Nocardioides sp. Root140]